MQTFLPYPDYNESAKVLDWKRLGKQRLETWQILQSLLALKEDPNLKPAWYHHPAVLQWKGYEDELRKYGIAVCVEWRRRGYKDKMLCEFLLMWKQTKDSKGKMPKWIGKKRLHLSHKSRLIQKDRKFYRKLWKKIPDNIEYWWPITIGDIRRRKNGTSRKSSA